MPAHTMLRSRTSSDAAILIAFEKIAAELEQDPKQCRVTVVVMDDYGSNHESMLSEIQSEPFAQYAKQHEGATWASVLISLEPLRLRINLRRDREKGDDEIRIAYQMDPSDPVEVSRSLIAIERQFVPLNRAAAIERALGPEMTEFYRLREEGLSRLETLTQKLVRETHDYRMRLDAEMAEHTQAITASFDEKNRVLEAKYEERTAALELHEKDLEKLRRDLDDRSARHARREQGRALQKKISDRSEKFTLTSATQRKRFPIHMIFVFLLLLSGGLTARSLLFPAMATEGVALWLELGRLPLGVLAFALTAVFYIRWNDQWFRQHADQEFKLQQLALDVDRAGYATEMLLEWQEDKEGEMPALMMDRLTAGLFTDQTTVARVRHPSEDITAALLKASSGVRVDVPGIGEVTLTGRQIRKLDKDLAKKRDE